MNPLVAYLRLMRAGLVLSPAADVMASLAIVGAAWNATAVAGMLASTCIYAAGMVFNDVADHRHDAIARPDRPLPAGAVSRLGAVGFGAGLLLLGVLLAPQPAFHLLLAGLVLLYDFASKKVRLLGALNMGLLRGLNLWSAAAYCALPAASMVPLRIAAFCYAMYIFSVTLLAALEDERSVRPRAVANLQAAPLLLGLWGVVAVQGSWWPAPVLAVLPMLWLARANRAITQWSPTQIRAAVGKLLLGTLLYDALLCLAAARLTEAAVLLVAIAPSRWLARHFQIT